MRLARLAAFVLLVVVTWYVLAVQAFAHAVLLDDGSEFYFDPWCCSPQEDCQEVPLTAITPKGDGWAVDYIDKKGKRVVGAIREGTMGQKWSPNHQTFACRQPIARPDKTYAPRCIYPQKPGM